MPFVPQVVDVVSQTPVVVASLIGDSLGLAAARCFEAMRIQMEAVFLDSHEPYTDSDGVG